MGFDVKKWLVEDMKFSADEAEQMAGKFTGERVTALESGYVGPDERAKIAAARTEIDSKTAALAAAEDKLNKDILEWAGLSEAEKSRATDLQARLDKSEQDALAARQALTRVAEQAGIDPKTVLPTAEPAKREETKVAPIDTSKFVTTEDFARIAAYQAELSTAMPFIAAEHFELTGKRIDTRSLMTELRKRAGQKNAEMDPVKVWEETHGIAQIRADRDAASRAAELKAAEERGEERARTAMSIPGASTTSHSRRPSPVLNPVHHADGRVGPRTSVLQRPQPGTAHNAAVAALRTRKYAEKSA